MVNRVAPPLARLDGDAVGDKVELPRLRVVLGRRPQSVGRALAQLLHHARQRQQARVDLAALLGPHARPEVARDLERVLEAEPVAVLVGSAAFSRRNFHKAATCRRGRSPAFGPSLRKMSGPLDPDRRP